MNNKKWHDILNKINSDPDLEHKDIIEEIRSKLVALLPQGKYKKWEDEGFNIHHLFQVEYIEYKGTRYYRYVDECTLLHVSAYFGLKGVVNALLAKGAKINAKGNDRSTSLHYAAGVGRVEVVNILLAKGAKVNAKGNDKGTPLHYAAGMGHVEVVSALLAKGAKINARSNDGITPLHYAAEMGCINVVKILLEQKANPCLKDNNGKTPRDLADLVTAVHLPYCAKDGKWRYEVKKKEIQQCLQKAEEKMQRHLKSIRVISVTSGCSAAVCETGIAVFFIVKGNLPVGPIPMILTAVASAVVALVVGCIVYQAFKEPGTKVDETQTSGGYNLKKYV